MTYSLAYLFFFSMSPLLGCSSPTVPDSLEGVYTQLREYERQANHLQSEIETPQQKEESQITIELLYQDLQQYRKEHPEIANVKELVECYRNSMRALRTIENNVNRYVRQHTADSINRILAATTARFDSAFNEGRRLVDLHRGDSVKLLKGKVVVWWAEDVESIRTAHQDLFAQGTELHEKYILIKKQRDAIAELSEKQPPKLREIMTFVLLALASITVIAGIVGSRIKANKIQKSVDDCPAMEL